MSLALHLAPDALAHLRRLNAGLQEEVLDELERLAAQPELIPSPLPQSGTVHTFAREVAGSLHVIALILEWSKGGSRLAVLGIRLF
ncbi:MAG: hypothetical protein JWL69_1152 [Phycisphaerales bacterium]|nr:hypothetical protein [Phycisphaerales bacterium]MDB5354553.1 hypothetical protein [Phycisphaerales bacterium]